MCVLRSTAATLALLGTLAAASCDAAPRFPQAIASKMGQS